jgi:HSP20 family protein
MTSNCVEKTNRNSCTATQPASATRVRNFSPAVDIVEAQDGFTLTADVPGATADGINVQFDCGVLTIEAAVRARNENPKTNFLFQEYGVGNYRRTFEINESIDAEKITAKVDNGVLTVSLPKEPKVQPKRIAVKQG